MDTNQEIEAAENELRAAQHAVSRALERLEEAKAKPDLDEPSYTGAIVRFQLRMSGVSYDFAALRSGTRWYTTGGTCPRGGYTWHLLWKFIRKHKLVGTMEIVTTDPANEW